MNEVKKARVLLSFGRGKLLLSAYAIQRRTGMAWEDIQECLAELTAEGKLKGYETTSGVFYGLVN